MHCAGYANDLKWIKQKINTMKPETKQQRLE